MEEITKDNYRSYDAINYSKLKNLAKHPSQVDVEIDMSEGMKNGDLLDLFCYEGEDAVHDKYYVSTLDSMPSDTMVDIVEEAENFSDEALYAASQRLGYGGSNWKKSTVIGKIEKQAGEYILELDNAAGKPIISYEMFVRMQNASSKVLNHKFTKRFFERNWEFQKPLCHELEIDENNNKMLFKGLLDGYINEDNVRVHDLKYTSQTLKGFFGQFMSQKYYIQAALYGELAHIESGSDELAVDYVVYSGAEDKVGVFTVYPSYLNLGKFGGKSYTGRYIKGYRQLARELQWHIDNNKWEYPYEIYKSNGVYKLEFQTYE